MSDRQPARQTEDVTSPNLPIVEPSGEQRREQTLAVHPPTPEQPQQRPLGLPVWRSSTFAFDTAQHYADVLGDSQPGYAYSRYDNPTANAFALGVAALEGQGLERPVGAQPFASGMAAISSVLLSLCSAGAHVVAPAAAYGGTFSLLRHLLERYAVKTTTVDLTDIDAVADAIRPETAVVWAETIANPTTVVADLSALSSICRDRQVPLVVDSTFASPAVCRPLQYGASVVVHSATKYLGGHSDVTGGVVVGAPDLLAEVRRTRIDLGGALSPDDAFLLHRGLATLPLRMRQHSASALAVAMAVQDHPAVERVDYPGLPGHPQHDLARKLFVADAGEPRYGGIVAITPRGGRDAGLSLCDGLRLASVATSLGGTHTVVSHAASTTHRQLDDAALRAAGIGPATVRFSIGLEASDDLVDDITTALDRLG